MINSQPNKLTFHAHLCAGLLILAGCTGPDSRIKIETRDAKAAKKDVSLAISQKGEKSNLCFDLESFIKSQSKNSAFDVLLYTEDLRIVPNKSFIDSSDFIDDEKALISLVEENKLQLEVLPAAKLFSEFRYSEVSQSECETVSFRIAKSEDKKEFTTVEYKIEKYSPSELWLTSNEPGHEALHFVVTPSGHLTIREFDANRAFASCEKQISGMARVTTHIYWGEEPNRIMLSTILAKTLINYLQNPTDELKANVNAAESAKQASINLDLRSYLAAYQDLMKGRIKKVECQK